MRKREKLLRIFLFLCNGYLLFHILLKVKLLLYKTVGTIKYIIAL